MIMEAHELMIGNYVQQDFGKIRYGCVTQINDNAVRLKMEFSKLLISAKDIEPIPLTAEWHNKFRAKKTGFDSFEYKCDNKCNLYLTVIFTGDYVMIRQGENKSIDDDIISVWNKDLIKRDMYVHEWQNLYFALTNKRLTL